MVRTRCRRASTPASRAPLLPPPRLLPRPPAPPPGGSASERVPTTPLSPARATHCESPFLFARNPERSPEMDVPEIRMRYLRQLAASGHAVIPSAPVVPVGDASTLFVSAG